MYKCARCGKDHMNLVFIKLRREVKEIGATHWCECPTTGEPILLRQSRLKKVLPGS
jgi:DNA-directed RNA polymerase subunit RPC12/RpoP